ncbi:MAG: MATE family efflux transporter [Treponema sp.]|nr:MATE family efflux transporter [Treponema sp.]
MKNSTLNMTEGNTTSLLIKFSIPMLIGNLFQQLYNIVDSVIVGKLVGADALAAVGVTGPMGFFFFALCNGIGSGGGIVTSQCFGSGDTKDVKSCISNVGYIMVAFPFVVGIAAFFLAGPLLKLLDTPEVIFADALAYLQILCIGLVFVSVYNYVSSMLRALGDSKTPLYFLIFSCILNTVLDVLFVKSFHMGVIGAGVATLIAQFVSGVACLIFAFRTNPFFKLSKSDWKINGEVIRRSVKIGIPLSLQFSLIAISTMALQRVVNAFGAVAVAAFTATSRVEQVIHQPYQTLSAALSTYTGQNFGAKKQDRVLLGYRKGMKLMVLFTILMLLVMQFFGKQITMIFINEAEVIDMGAKSLKITSWFYFFLGLIYVVRGVLNGVGDSFFALFNGIIEVIGRFTFPVLMTMIPVFGLWGIWWSVGVVWLLSGITAWFRYIWFRKKTIGLQEMVKTPE